MSVTAEILTGGKPVPALKKLLPDMPIIDVRK